MCGIAGLYNYGGSERDERPDLCRVRDTMAHRGPDASGLYQSPDRRVVLGHRRLSIVDLSDAGRQPMSNEDGSIWITFNGEIYNHQQHRAPLLAMGHQFRSHTDTECIIHLYEEFGVDCISRLDGMFAFALWDQNRRTMLLARDRLGKKPVYYTISGGKLLFASEIKALLQYPGIARDVDVEARELSSRKPAPAVSASVALPLESARESGQNSVVPKQPAKKSFWSNVGEFILLGIEHILTGYDHMAFLLALIIIGLSIREVLKIITAFTVAHSITLLLAATQVVSLNSRVVESVIAFSICYVALENLIKKKVDYRWLLTFGFGLIHGFGFASVLQELIVGKSNLLVSVVSFNLGVELGQLTIFLVLLPVLHLLRNKIEFRKVTVGVSLAIFILGFTWLIERGFNLKFLPI